MNKNSSAGRRSANRDEAFAAAFQEQKRQDTEDGIQDLGEVSVLWLALAPYWTEPLARWSDFPLRQDYDLSSFLNAAVARGWCTRRLPEASKTSKEGFGQGFFQEDATPEFWAPSQARFAILEHLQTTLGSERLLDIATQIAARIDEANYSDLPIPLSIARWAALVERSHVVSLLNSEIDVTAGLSQAANWLTNRIESLAARDLTGEALAWVRTGEDLARIFRGPLEAAIRSGSRRLELSYRLEADRRHLSNFLERREQIDSFLDCLEGSNEQWAIHFLGHGGMGKTMLLRHITTNLATQKNFAVSRVDFDYLSPNYPVRQPGLLLITLAQQLKSYAVSTQIESVALDLIHHESADSEIRSRQGEFDRFQQMVTQYHSDLSLALPQDDLLANVNSLISGQFTSVLQSFVDLLRLLPQERVVLILDTCEELSKLQPIDAKLPNVEATFLILEKVREQLPDKVRVVFSGRRLLAYRGYHWEATKQTANAKSAATSAFVPTILPTEKSYLRIHEIKGFNESQARRYFAERKLELKEELLQAILGRSLDTGQNSIISISGSNDNQKVPRYNPFYLSLYADWIEEHKKEHETPLNPEIITSGTIDPYIKIRIIGRIQNENVKRLLPAVAVLRRFDKAMLRSVFEGGDEAFDEAFQELVVQEWIDIQDVSFQDRLAVVENFYPRFYAYYAPPVEQSLNVIDPDQVKAQEDFKKVRERLAPALAQIIRDKPLEELSVSNIEAALRLLDPAKATELWQEIVRRIPEVGYSWARTVTGRLLGEEGVAGSLQSPLRAAVQAVYTAAMIHTEPDFNPLPNWCEVEKTAENHPDKDQCAELRLRALAGLVPAVGQVPFRRIGKPITKELLTADNAATITAFWEQVKQFAHSNYGESDAFEQLAASLCAAIDQIVEGAESTDKAISDSGELEGRGYGERLNFDYLIPDPDLIANWAQQLAEGNVSSDLKAYSYCLAGRACCLFRQFTKANQFFSTALELCNSLPDASDTEATPSSPDVSTASRSSVLRSLTRWLDWGAPVSIVDRVRLEVLLHHSRPLPAWMEKEMGDAMAEGTDQYIGNWLQGLFGGLKQIDADRLVSAIIQFRLERGTISGGLLADFQGVNPYDQTKQPLCLAHTAVQPLFVTIARGWCALGEIDRALDLLGEHSRQATQSARDTLTPQAARNEEIRIIRRMRLGSTGRLASRVNELISMSRSKQPQLLVKALPGLGLLGFPVLDTIRKTDRKAAPYQWWQSATVLNDRNQAGALLIEMQQRWNILPQSSHFLDRITQELDREEARLLVKRFNLSGQFGFLSHPPQSVPTFNIIPWQSDLPSRQIRAVRVALRYQALQDVEQDAEIIISLLQQLVGVRKLAELALEEGELLALRLPHHAQRLLACAFSCFNRVDDPAGATIAAIRWCIAAIHCENSNQANSLLQNEVKNSYQELSSRQSNLGLPAWEFLQDLTKFFSLINLKNEWRFWLSRLLACSAWVRGSSEYEEWRSTYSGFSGVYGNAIPAELQFPERQPSVILESINAGNSIEILAGDSVSFDAGDTGTSTTTSNGTEDVPTLEAEKSPLFLEIVSLVPQERPALHPSEMVPVAMMLQQGEQIFRGEGKSPGLRGGEAYLEVVPQQVREALRDVYKECCAGRKPLEVALQIDPALELWPWEAVLRQVIDHESAPNGQEGSALLFWRTSPLQSSKPPAFWARPGQVIAFASRTWRSLVEDSWKGMGSRIYFADNRNLFAEYAVRDIDREGRMNVQHRIGIPLRTTSGLHLQVLSDTEKQSSLESITSERAGTLLRPEQLSPEDAAIVVIQGEPVDSVGTFGSERERLCDLRAYAAAVFAAGAFSVIMIPAMRELWAVDILRQLADSLRTPTPPNRTELLKVVNDMRDNLARQTAQFNDSLACEITLFTRK